MELSKTVAVTALVLALVLSVGHARAQFSAAPNEGPRTAAAMVAADEAAQKRRDAQEAAQRNAEQRFLEQRRKNDEVARRCSIRPVMTDGEINACRVAYRS